MNQALVFRDAAITTKYQHFFRVLQVCGSQQRLNRADVMRQLKLSSPQASRILRDGQHLGLWDEELNILALGRQWQRELLLHGRLLPETLRQGVLNVRVFAQLSNELPKIDDEERIFTYLREHTCAARPTELGCATRRYIEGYFQRTLPRALRRPMVQARVSREPIDLQSQNLRLVQQYEMLINRFGKRDVAACHAFLYREQ